MFALLLSSFVVSLRGASPAVCCRPFVSSAQASPAKKSSTSFSAWASTGDPFCDLFLADLRRAPGDTCCGRFWVAFQCSANRWPCLVGDVASVVGRLRPLATPRSQALPENPPTLDPTAAVPRRPASEELVMQSVTGTPTDPYMVRRAPPGPPAPDRGWPKFWPTSRQSATTFRGTARRRIVGRGPAQRLGASFGRSWPTARRR